MTLKRIKYIHSKAKNPQLLIKKKYQGILVKPPKSIKEQNELGEECVEWSLLPESLAIEDFPLSKRMSPYRFYRIADDNEYFHDCLEFARYMIGSKLKKAVRDNILPLDYVFRELPLLNRELRQFLLDKSSKDTLSKQGVFQVVEIPQYPESKLVPPYNQETEQALEDSYNPDNLVECKDIDDLKEKLS